MVAARGEDGAYAAFDTVENRHRDHILDLTLRPGAHPAPVDRQAQAIARRIADALDLVGLLAVEMFVDRDGRVLVNEIAPRPHNSGHWTIDACPASQFELHIRAIRRPAAAAGPGPASDAVMKNLVGPEGRALGRRCCAPGLIPHLYGKAEARPGRKMGHVTRLFPRGSLATLDDRHGPVRAVTYLPSGACGFAATSMRIWFGPRMRTTPDGDRVPRTQR